MAGASVVLRGGWCYVEDTKIALAGVAPQLLDAVGPSPPPRAAGRRGTAAPRPGDRLTRWRPRAARRPFRGHGVPRRRPVDTEVVELALSSSRWDIGSRRCRAVAGCARSSSPVILSHPGTNPAPRSAQPSPVREEGDDIAARGDRRRAASCPPSRAAPCVRCRSARSPLSEVERGRRGVERTARRHLRRPSLRCRGALRRRRSWPARARRAAPPAPPISTRPRRLSSPGRLDGGGLIHSPGLTQKTPARVW